MPTYILALTIAGSLVGAGFASGQEIWQFFGAFGAKGVFGLILSLMLFALFSSLFLNHCVKNKIFSYEKAVFPTAPRFCRVIFSFFENLIFFFLSTIMISGASEAIKSFIPPEKSNIFAICFALLCALVTLLGIKGLVRIFSFFMPLLIAVSLIIFVCVLSGKEKLDFSLSATGGSGLLNNFLTSSLLYLSYSFFASVGLLAPLSRHVKSAKSSFAGSFLGMLLLTLVALSILLSMLFTGTTGDFALPMVTLAGRYSPILEYLYSTILILAMFACATTSEVAFFEWLFEKVKIKKPLRIISALTFSIAAWYLSLGGFTTLVSTIYPIYGYIGFIVIAAVLFNALRRNKNG